MIYTQLPRILSRCYGMVNLFSWSVSRQAGCIRNHIRDTPSTLIIKHCPNTFILYIPHWCASETMQVHETKLLLTSFQPVLDQTSLIPISLFQMSGPDFRMSSHLITGDSQDAIPQFHTLLNSLPPHHT